MRSGVLIERGQARGERADPEATSNPVTHGPSDRDSSTAPPTSNEPKPTNESCSNSWRGEQYVTEQPTSPMRLTESTTKLSSTVVAEATTNSVAM